MIIDSGVIASPRAAACNSWVQNNTAHKPGKGEYVLMRVNIGPNHTHYEVGSYDHVSGVWRSGLMNRGDDQVTHWADINVPEGCAK